MTKRVTFVSPFSDASKVEIETDFCQCELVSFGAAKYCPVHAAIKEMDELLKYPWPDDEENHIVDANKKVGDEKGSKETIGSMITPARERLGYSMSECSRRIDVSHPYWHQMEHDKEIPSIALLSKVCRLLGLNFDKATKIREHIKKQKDIRKQGEKKVLSWIRSKKWTAKQIEDALEFLKKRMGP